MSAVTALTIPGDPDTGAVGAEDVVDRAAGEEGSGWMRAEQTPEESVIRRLIGLRPSFAR
jgi:hypothetical protein